MYIINITDLHPSGESTLVAYGLLNLTHFQGHTKEKVRDLVPGEVLPVTVNIHSASYVVPVGHSLLLCLSSALWPAAWPSSKVNIYFTFKKGVKAIIRCLKKVALWYNVKKR